MNTRLAAANLLLLPCWAQQRPAGDAGRIRQLIASYAAAADAADVKPAAIGLGQLAGRLPDPPARLG